MLSWIQKNALLVLLRQATATMRQMRPEGVEANLFSYHIDGLLADGHIYKVSRGTYALTPKGERLVGSFSTATNKPNEYLKTVIVLYAKTGDSYLLFKWSRQPYLGKVALLHDHLPLGRSLADGLVEAAHDKLNATLVPRYETSVLVRIEHDGELVTHMNALVYQVDISGIELPYTSRNGTAFMAPIDELPDAMGGLDLLLKDLETLTEPREYTLSY